MVAGWKSEEEKFSEERLCLLTCLLMGDPGAKRQDWNEAPRWNDWNYFPTFACCLPPRAFFYFEH
jgi:hypothetical protein